MSNLPQRPRLLLLPPADAEPARDHDLLYVGRSTRMQRRDRVALEVLDRAFERTPALVVREHARACDAQHALRDVEPGELAPQAVLRAFVRARLPGVREPVIPKREEPRDFGFDVQLGDLGARARLVADRVAACVALAAHL